MTIVIDTREQAPFAFPENIETIRSGLKTGDYALQHDEGFAVERKSLPDFVSSIINNRDRFERELDRMAGWPAKIIMVEASLDMICAHDYPNAKIKPAFVLKRMGELAMSDVQVLLAGDPMMAAAWTLAILRERAFAIGTE